MGPKRWSCKWSNLLFTVSATLNHHLILDKLDSTITYDTLVRGGVKVVSAFVPDLTPSAGGEPHSVSPPVAKGSRGINIMPDTYLDLAHCGPVGISFVNLSLDERVVNYIC